MKAELDQSKEIESSQKIKIRELVDEVTYLEGQFKKELNGLREENSQLNVRLMDRSGEVIQKSKYTKDRHRSSSPYDR